MRIEYTFAPVMQKMKALLDAAGLHQDGVLDNVVDNVLKNLVTSVQQRAAN